ncbi:MAG: hypothetical protein MMC33_002284 [Icmadophila ericetorum]|nr:hypothetical protein [Icmadophila ericetorum]
MLLPTTFILTLLAVATSLTFAQSPVSQLSDGQPQNPFTQSSYTNSSALSAGPTYLNATVAPFPANTSSTIIGTRGPSVYLSTTIITASGGPISTYTSFVTAEAAPATVGPQTTATISATITSATATAKTGKGAKVETRLIAVLVGMTSVGTGMWIWG